MSLLRICIALAFVMIGSPVWADDAAEKVVEIQVKGSVSLSAEKVQAVLRQRVGENYNPGVVNDDIKRVWKMGLFSDVRVLAETTPKGLKLVYEVSERPTIQELRFFGNKKVSDSSLKDKANLVVDSTYDQAKLATAVKAIEDLYKEKDYYAISVQAETKPGAKSGQVIVNFRINEGNRMKIEKIDITGSKAFSANRVKGAMRDTREAGWLTGGSYDPKKLAEDLVNVLKFYAREGYAKAKLEGYSLDQLSDKSASVARQVTEFDEAGKRILLKIKIDEGVKYTWQGVSLTGNTVFKTSDLLEKMDTPTDKVYNQERWDGDLLRLRTTYSEKGYIYAGVTPEYTWDDVSGTVSAAITVSEGVKAYIEDIKIRGNDVTKEKVIRRQITLKPGDPFDSETVNKNRMKIYNLGFFENVAVDTQPGTEMDKLTLIYDVAPERKTGQLSIGAGYSSVEGLVGFLQVAQNNLFGNGQSVSAQWDFGDRKRSYSLSFTEPWLLDTPTSFGVDVYRTQRSSLYSSQGFAQDSTGGSLRLGRLLNEDWKVFSTYRYQSDYTYDVRSDLIGISEGIENISSITPSIVRDTRDNIFDASRGSNNTFSITMAGGYLGGDKHFIKPVYDSRIHFTTPAVFGWRWLNKFVLGLHGRVGYATPFDAGLGLSSVPVSERFFMGGTDTVRGYQERSLGASYYGGGHFSVLSNVEYGFKPVPPLKLRVFYDSGNTWQRVDDVDWQRPYLYPSYGFGMLFTIPTSVIQIRLDWGFPLDPNYYVNGGRIHFNIGNIF